MRINKTEEILKNKRISDVKYLIIPGRKREIGAVKDPLVGKKRKYREEKRGRGKER